MKSSFINVFGKVSAAAAISLLINLPSQADAVPDLCGFNREYFLNQHTPKLKETYGTRFSFDGEDTSTSLPLIPNEILMEEALDKGYGWVYGCPKGFNIHEAARLNPWIKENFDTRFPIVSISSVDKMEVKAFYMRYVQDAVLNTFYNFTPLVWVEGVAPDFDWQGADISSGEAKTPEENWIERAHNLQVQARDKRLEALKLDIYRSVGGFLKTDHLNARHLWVADKIHSEQPTLEHAEILTQLLEVETVIPGFLTGTPEDFAKDAYRGLIERVKAKAKEFTTELEEGLNIYKTPRSAKDKKKTTSSSPYNPEQTRFAVNHKINQLINTLAETNRKIDSADSWGPLCEQVSFIKRNITIEMDYFEAYEKWLSTGRVTAPESASEFMDTSNEILLMSQYLRLYQEDARLANVRFNQLQPETFLKEFKPKFTPNTAPTMDDLNVEAKKLMKKLDLKAGLANNDPDSARETITGNPKDYRKLFFNMSSNKGCTTQKVGTVLNKLQLEQKKYTKNQTFSDMYVFKDEFDKEQFRYFIAHRGQHTYLVYLQPTK